MARSGATSCLVYLWRCGGLDRYEHGVHRQGEFAASVRHFTGRLFTGLCESFFFDEMNMNID